MLCTITQTSIIICARAQKQRESHAETKRITCKHRSNPCGYRNSESHILVHTESTRIVRTETTIINCVKTWKQRESQSHTQTHRNSQNYLHEHRINENQPYRFPTIIHRNNENHELIKKIQTSKQKMRITRTQIFTETMRITRAPTEPTRITCERREYTEITRIICMSTKKTKYI